MAATDPTAISGSVPWGWRDIVRAIVLSVASLVALFVLLVIAMVVRQLMGTSDFVLGVYAAFQGRVL